MNANFILSSYKALHKISWQIFIYKQKNKAVEIVENTNISISVVRSFQCVWISNEIVNYLIISFKKRKIVFI